MQVSQAIKVEKQIFSLIVQTLKTEVWIPGVIYHREAPSG